MRFRLAKRALNPFGVKKELRWEAKRRELDLEPKQSALLVELKEKIPADVVLNKLVLARDVPVIELG